MASIKFASKKLTTGKLRVVLAASLISAAPLHAAFAAGGSGGGHGAAGTGANGHSGTSGNVIGGPTETTATPNKVTNYFTPPPVTSLATPFIQNTTPNSSQISTTGTTIQTQPTTTNNTTTPNNAAPNNNAQTSSNSTVATEQNATTGTSNAPENVHVGHAANGLPIGSRGSGPGSPEQPIDSGTR